MKKTILRIISLLLVCLIAPTALYACASFGEPVMKLGSTEITGNMVEFWMSRYKAQFVYYYGAGIKAQYSVLDLKDFWPMKADESTGKTFDDMFSDYIIDNAKTYLCALYLFDQFGLKLPAATVDAVDETMKKLVDDYAEGSKSEFNTLIAAYGVNYKILRELYLIDEKVDVLKEFLYGTGGSEAITSAQKEAYYQENYVRLKQICIFINECPETDENGKYVTDDDGYTKYREMTDEENSAAKKKAEEALTKINNGTDFDRALTEYDENHADDEYTNGIYMSADSAYGSDQNLQSIYETVCGMEVGQVKLIELEHGLHVIKKLPLDAGAYEVTANNDFFIFWDADTQTYQNYEQYLVTPMFLDYIAEHLASYSSEMKIDEEMLASYRISKVEENYYY